LVKVYLLLLELELLTVYFLSSPLQLKLTLLPTSLKFQMHCAGFSFLDSFDCYAQTNICSVQINDTNTRELLNTPPMHRHTHTYTCVWGMCDK